MLDCCNYAVRVERCFSVPLPHDWRADKTLWLVALYMCSLMTSWLVWTLHRQTNRPFCWYEQLTQNWRQKSIVWQQKSADFCRSCVIGINVPCLHGSHAVDVAARRISWCPSHGMWSTLQWSYCSLVCDAIMLQWEIAGQAMSRSLEIWCPVYGHAAQRGQMYTLQYCSQDNSTASTDCGSLTRYIRGGAFDGAFKALCTSWFAFMAALTQWSNYLCSANFCLHYLAEYE